MTKLKQDFVMYAGDTKNLKVTVTEQDGNLVDMSGSSIKWELKNYSKKSDYVVQKSTPDNITIDSIGNITIRLDSSDTQDLRGNYYHSCELVDVVGNVSTLFTGFIRIT